MSCDLLLDRLSQNAKTYASKKAVTFLAPGKNGGKVEREMTYEQFEAETTALAGRLLEKGLKQGDRALLVYPPSLEFMLAFLGCLKAGVVAVPCFPPNPARKDTLLMFSRITESSGAKFALTSNEYNHLKKLVGVKDIFTKFTKSRQQASTATWPEQLVWIITDSTANSKKTQAVLPTPAKSDLAFLQVSLDWHVTLCIVINSSFHLFMNSPTSSSHRRPLITSNFNNQSNTIVYERIDIRAQRSYDYARQFGP